MKHSNNFTALRWFAAGMVLYGHSFVFLGLPEPLFLGWTPLGPLGVFVFFSISGYLVSQSWTNDPDFIRFVQRRAIRIFPGLIVCIFLSIFPFGFFISHLDGASYFKHAATRGYLTNIFLYTTYYLPGVFENNRVANAVNGSLWSLPAEFFMYLLLAALGLLKVKRGILISIFLIFVLGTIFWATKAQEMLVIYRTDARQVVICGGYFMMGVLLHRFDLIKHFSAANVVAAAIIWLCLYRWSDIFAASSYVAIPIFSIALGTGKTPGLSWLSKFDFSYGIYIYAFPVQQALVYYFPKIGLPLYLLTASILTIILSALSWYLIEKPALQFKPASPNRNFKQNPYRHFNGMRRP